MLEVQALDMGPIPKIYVKSPDPVLHACNPSHKEAEMDGSM